MAEVATAIDLAQTEKAAVDQAAQAQQDRVSRLISQAQAAMAGGNVQDLDAARMELDGVTISSSEAAIIQSFVQGVLTEAQTRQALQIAQDQQAKTANASATVTATVAADGMTVTASADPAETGVVAKIEPVVEEPRKTAINPETIAASIAKGPRSIAG